MIGNLLTFLIGVAALGLGAVATQNLLARRVRVLVHSARRQAAERDYSV
jgi:hypothetical protein